MGCTSNSFPCRSSWAHGRCSGCSEARNLTPNGQRRTSTGQRPFSTRTQALSRRLCYVLLGGCSGRPHTCRCMTSSAEQIQTPPPFLREVCICLQQQDAHPKSPLSQVPLQLGPTLCPILGSERLGGSLLGVGIGSSSKAPAFQEKGVSSSPSTLLLPGMWIPYLEVRQPSCDHEPQAEDSRARSQRSPLSQPGALPQAPHTPLPFLCATELSP